MTYYDETAEKALLGVALLAPKATAPLRLTEADFHHPVHGSTWEAIHAAHTDGLTPDATTVLARVPEAQRRFAAELLVEVVGLGAVSNAEAYADTIRDRAERRRIASVLDGARQRLDQPDEAAHDTLAYIERHVTQGGQLDQAAEKLWALDEFLDRNLPPVSWVIPDLLAEGERLVLTGTEGMGKALALDTPIPTPDGWTTMGTVRVGDLVLTPHGQPTRVVAATDVMHDRPCYRVTFSDGSTIVADAQHEWATQTLAERDTGKPHAMRTTEAIAATLLVTKKQARNHSIATTLPLDLPDRDLPIDPYVLGAWLGDGTSRNGQFTCCEQDVEIMQRVGKHYPVRRLATPMQWSTGGGANRKTRSLQATLRREGLLQNKHIPADYLRASYTQRLALMQGLMDTDGSIATNGVAPSCEFTTTSERLASGVAELAHTLGAKVSLVQSTAQLNGETIGPRWRVRFQTELPVFHLARKADRIKPFRTERSRRRYITSVEPIESVPVRCIQVSNSAHMYLAGRSMIPTHNSVLMRQIGVMVSAGLDPFTLASIPAKRVLFVDCENPERIMMSRLGELRQVAHARRTAPSMYLRRFPQGLDLASPRDRLELHHLCALVRPELLLIGPAYKLYIGGSGAREEDLARQVTNTLDQLREEFGFALILEHHSPHASPGSEQRSVRPIGSSLWLRWPEFGMGIRPQKGTRPTDRQGELIPWRGPRDERPWPEQLTSGGVDSLPWVSADMVRPQRRVQQ